MKQRADGDIDPIVHGPTRLAILSALAEHTRLSFSALNDVVVGSAGKLSAQLRKLEEAGYVKVHRHFEGRIARRDYSLTTLGRDALNRYLETMAEMVARSRRRDP